MRLLKLSTNFAFYCFFKPLTFCWNFLVTIIEFIDGGDDEEFEDDIKPIHYNYRSGEIDPVKRLDGQYK